MQVVLYDQNSTMHDTWSKQFVDADKLNRKRIGMNGNGSAIDLVKKIVDAAKDAKGGDLIFAVGHGGTQLTPNNQTFADGMVDLSPNKKLRLSVGGNGNFANPFYDYVFARPGLVARSDKDQDQDTKMNLAGAHQRLANWQLYQNIGTAVRTNGVHRVTFLTCRIGNALNFLKKIALDWHVIVKAYKKYVWFGGDGTGKIRVYLDGDSPGQGTNVAEAATQVPQSDFVQVGPPL